MLRLNIVGLLARALVPTMSAATGCTPARAHAERLSSVPMQGDAVDPWNGMNRGDVPPHGEG